MCGIAGSVNFFFDTDRVNKVMGHRGPDERASFRCDNVLLQHLRLAIVDISGGKQPMRYLDRYTIIFNGEIYNHKDVRKELALDCVSGSDTETILHAWHKKGPTCLDYFDGMFALAIYDSQTKQLFVARDRAGKKPLYYFANGTELVFASELNALRELLPLQADHEHIAAYLRMGSFFKRQTPYNQVFELQAGHHLTVDTVTLAMKEVRWWNIGDFYRKPILAISEQDALAETDALLRQAVRRRLESSDLEVGSFLSGGIDSGLITAIAAEIHPKIKTFTVSFPGAYDEAPLARLVAEKYKTEHQEIAINFNHLLEDVEGIISQYGEPFFDNSAIPSHYVSKAASKRLTVILNGDGADELFGGYRRQVPFAKFDFFNSNALVGGVAKAASALLPPANERKSTYSYISRLLSLAGKKGFATYLASWTDIFEGFEKYILKGNNTYMHECEELIEQISAKPISGLRKLMWLDFDVSLFDALLPKIDIATMAHSLEGRSPMLCKEFMEWVPTLPDHLKVNGKTTKYLLRKLAEKYLPPTLVHQPKRGFEIPLKMWVNHELKDMIAGYLNTNDRFYPNLMDHQFVMKLLDRKVKVSEEKRAKMLWSIFCLEVWYHKCLKQE